MLLTAVMVSLTATRLSAQEDDESGLTPEQQELFRKYHSIKWQDGPCTAALGTVATIKVPAGYRVTDALGTNIWSEVNGNAPNERNLGLLTPIGTDDVTVDDFVVMFSFNDTGYVKDDEKDKLDANAILASLRAGNDEANKYRAAHGVAPLEIIGWMTPPAYDEATHNLVWAVKGRSQTEEGVSQEVVNYNTRVLGRHGVMSVNLIAEPDAIPRLMPTAKQILANFEYNAGSRYAEFKAGDKVAAYGLAALVAGGTAAVAMKTGLFAKLALVFAKAGKAIVIGVLAFFGWIAKLFTGRKRSAS
jgi:uncharacterized membrane-anchored protein